MTESMILSVAWDAPSVSRREVQARGASGMMLYKHPDRRRLNRIVGPLRWIPPQFLGIHMKIPWQWRVVIF